MQTLASAFLRQLDPERAHALAILALRAGLGGADTTPDDPRLAVPLFGRLVKNPIGLAAGFDKNAVALKALSRLGFGFIETGTITPRPQAGNPRPRLFRLPEDGAVINRMGFNNAGLTACAARLAAFHPRPVPVGANIGINKEGADPERDYPALLATVAPHADYVVINVSSPNTPGLRDLQGEARLAAILAALPAARPPLFVKLAPDLAAAALEAAADVAIAAGVTGIIVTNTTISRPPGLRSVYAKEAGGLSGAPLAPLAREALRIVARRAAGRLTLIASGGIATGADVLARLRLGATAVQIYTAMIYAGPGLIARLKRELLAELDAAKLADVAAAIGTDL
ncbi:MAG: quinone-dependent dihydroorotate dehydrogenase [Rhodospirillales bacterium]|nr:quinone-dependent dihydroorotate dehydrogenase [Rhodospirillales bacterium]